uniref:Uncharacterized protein n=1 Tax=Rhizophora mucronata TaxID=61149 RepID=A0A2P2MXI4_RHIMU
MHLLPLFSLFHHSNPVAPRQVATSLLFLIYSKIPIYFHCPTYKGESNKSSSLASVIKLNIQNPLTKLPQKFKLHHFSLPITE